MCDDCFVFYDDSENCFKLSYFFITYRTYKEVGGTYMSPALVAQETLPPNLVSLVPLVIILGLRRRQARLVGMRNRDIHTIT